MVEAATARAVIVSGSDSGGVLLADLPQLKVLRTVVRLVAIAVVHPFMGFKKPAKRAFHDKAMLGVSGSSSAGVVRRIDVDISAMRPCPANHHLVGVAGERQIGPVAPSEHVLAVPAPRPTSMTGDEAMGIARVDVPGAVGVLRHGGCLATAALTKASGRNPISRRDQALTPSFPRSLEVPVFVGRGSVPMVRFGRDLLAASADANQLLHNTHTNKKR